jgi:hypothetical protein
MSSRLRMEFISLHPREYFAERVEWFGLLESFSLLDRFERIFLCHFA